MQQFATNYNKFASNEIYTNTCFFMDSVNHTEIVNAYVNEQLSRREMNEFWADISNDKSALNLLYTLLIEKWHNKNLSPFMKDMAVKLYKDSADFRKMFLRYEVQLKISSNILSPQMIFCDS